MAYDIIILAGQSNAEGNGVRIGGKEVLNDNVFQVVDKNPAFIYEDSNKKTILDIKIPTDCMVELAHERSCGENFCADISETFANNYINAGLLKNDRKVLIVKTAVGGSGFAKEQWGIGNPLFTRAIEMIKYALSLEKNSKIVACLWHQGEHDAFENAEFTDTERYNFYYDKLLRQTLEFRKIFATKFPFICGGFVRDWGLLYLNQVESVEKASQDVCNTIGLAGFCSSEGLLSNNQAIKNGDNIHFCVDSIYELANRYFNKYMDIMKNESNKDLE